MGHQVQGSCEPYSAEALAVFLTICMFTKYVLKIVDMDTLLHWFQSVNVMVMHD